MAIAHVGTAAATGARASGAQSVSITIPAGANAAILVPGYWLGSGAASISAVSLDGHAASLVDEHNDGASNDSTQVWYVSGFSSGAGKTLAYTNAAAYSDGVNWAVEFLSGVDVGGTPTGAHGSDTGDSAITGSLAANSGDWAVMGWCSDNTPTFNTGQTNRVTSGSGSVTCGITTEPLTGADTQGITDGSFSSIAAVVLKPAAAGGSVTGSGTPTAQSATTAGTSERSVKGTGTPSAQSAATAGTGERSVTGSGAPAAQSATTAGTGTVGAVVTGTGAPTAQSATSSGTGERSVVGTGTPTAQSATVAGTAERSITGTGTPAAQSASTTGTGERSITGSGTPAAQSATVAGEGETASGVFGSGIVVAQSATVEGTGERSITGAGDVIAQSAIVVGIGTGPPAPVSDIERPSGGWLFLNQYESEKQRRRAEARRRKQLEDETDEIQDELDRSIAQLLREQEAKDAKRTELERLGALAKANADIEAAREYSERVATAFARAIAQGNFSALESLDREMRRAAEEEEFILTAIMLLMD